MNNGYHEKEYKAIEDFIVSFFSHNGRATKKYYLSYDDNISIIVSFFNQKNLYKTIERYIQTGQLEKYTQENRMFTITFLLEKELQKLVNNLKLDIAEKKDMHTEIMKKFYSILGFNNDALLRYKQYKNSLTIRRKQRKK